MKKNDKRFITHIWPEMICAKLIKTSGESMQPLIVNGAKLTLTACKPSGLSPGDIALIRQNNHLIAHRIVFRQKYGNKLYLGHKGDNALAIVLAPAKDILGKVAQIHSIPEGVLYLDGKFWRWINRILGLYWSFIWLIFKLAYKPKTPEQNPIYLPFSSIHQKILKLLLSLGLKKNPVKEKFTHQQVISACINKQPLSPTCLFMEKKEWEEFLKAVKLYNIQGFCYSYLNRYKKMAPPYVLTELGKFAHATGFHNMKINSELKRLLQTFQKIGIEVILLKGVALLQQVYPNPIQRRMRDIDFLIRKTDLPKVEAELSKMGYKADEKDGINSKWYRKYSIKINYYKSGKTDYKIDVHWGFERYNNPFPISYEEIWGRSQKIEQNGTTFRLLSAEDMLLHLSMHMVFQHCLRLDTRAWLDIIHIIRLKPDWDKVILLAGQYKLESIVYVALHIANKLANVEIPQRVLKKLRRSFRHSLVKKLDNRITGFNIQAPRLETWWRLKLIKGWRARIIYLGSILYPSRDELSILENFNSNSLIAYLIHLLKYYVFIVKKTKRKSTLNNSCYAKNLITPS